MGTTDGDRLRPIPPAPTGRGKPLPTWDAPAPPSRAQGGRGRAGTEQRGGGDLGSRGPGPSAPARVRPRVTGWPALLERPGSWGRGRRPGPLVCARTLLCGRPSPARWHPAAGGGPPAMPGGALVADGGARATCAGSWPSLSLRLGWCGQGHLSWVRVPLWVPNIAGPRRPQPPDPASMLTHPPHCRGAVPSCWLAFPIRFPKKTKYRPPAMGQAPYKAPCSSRNEAGEPSRSPRRGALPPSRSPGP